MNKYQENKEKARNKVIEWQLDVSNHNYSCSEFASWCDYFYKLGKRYGLLKEFKENGIC